jgi:predicted helicase
MRKAKIYYARMDEFWRKEEKLRHLEKLGYIDNVDWQEIKPDKNNTWLSKNSEVGFGYYLPIGNRDAKAASEANQEVIFKLFSLGVSTNRDTWVRNFNVDALEKCIKKTIEAYNEQVNKWINRDDKSIEVDNFISHDDTRIGWSSTLKSQLKRGTICKYDSKQNRNSLYRPFCSQFLYFDDVLNDRRGQFPSIFPIPKSEKENQVICLPGIGNRQAFGVYVAQCILALDFAFEKAQCFPFYIYHQDGANRRENITDWSLEQFQTHYQDPSITKWDIFNYTYAILHHPHYRTRYVANLKRELPRIPFAPTFRPFATAGDRLAEIHIHYEQQPEYLLKHQENKDLPIDWRVEKMRLSKDKTQLKYNDFLTLTDIPPEAFEYRLGNRSALHWVIDQYQISTDKRSGITNDPNRLDDEEYIVRLIKQVITVSLETVQIVKDLPDLGLPKDE